MLAAEASYTDKKPMPLELQLALQHDRWGVLPYDGGLLDQPVGLLDRMAWASAVHRAFSGRDKAHDAITWIQGHEELYELYSYVKGMRKLVTEGWEARDAQRVMNLVDGGKKLEQAKEIVRGDGD